MLLKNKFFITLTGSITIYAIAISIASFQIISDNEKEITIAAKNVENKYIEEIVSDYASDISDSLSAELDDIKSIEHRYLDLIKEIGNLNTKNMIQISTMELEKHSTVAYITNKETIINKEPTDILTRQYKINPDLFLNFETNISSIIRKISNDKNHTKFTTLLIDTDINMLTGDKLSNKYLKKYKNKFNDPKGITTLNKSERVMLEKIKRKEEWNSEMGFDNEQYIAAIRPVIGYSWNIGVIIKKKDSKTYNQELTKKIHNNYNAIVYKIISMVIIITIITLITSTIITNYIKNTLVLFNKWIKEIRHGNYEYNNPLLDRKDELGILARNVSKMAQHVSTRVDNLEGEINDRTDKLKKAKEIAESANINKSTFIANISHELRTPLNAILGLSLYLSEKETDKDKKETLDTLHHAGLGLLEMVNDVLDLSKIEADKTVLNNESHSIETIITNTINIVKNQSQLKDISIEFKNHQFSNIKIDKNRLTKIVMNLLSNAIKFTDIGGQIIINVSYIKTSTSSTDVILEFTDNGRGIHEQDINRVFEPFEQMYNKDNEHGTGLGLFITKKIIEDMNGEISIKSKINIGTSIYVTLKNIEIDQSRIITKKQVSERQLAKIPPLKRIAIVDDIQFNREVLKRKLEPYKFKIIEGINGQDLLDKLAQCSQLPDAIFTDIKMPVMNGIELSQIIKSKEDMQHIPVIAITAQGMLNEEIEIKQHCDGYLVKPIENSKLDDIVARIFEDEQS
ncbi:ATP-binding protein [Aliivibrio sp. S4TY2]|uniref:ATP-binding response regulator n=1 Tax=unclassified Aliivibrio TaxID=2645654 RepID=UPI002378ED93|nr:MULTISPECIES: ATP-binding protein [unclassified Aliivibrio]MDD9158192.1 ATP-binding protein [Aliivibrio sp. S4TY2]MDD9162107.1 ATP-binding protein [Aliivibrio sp. S4TY1]MDD9166145.1 ATP-binding protein [Aliivibrio sp. S4MY2]MDD9170143.1 ATP-binding protein [Aliivibrio sp. S4MY4]MDD9187212.1 ATP-binding protein [Aliivibrio sp. S4MY3]